MDSPRALRTYRGTDPTLVMPIINSLSYKCRLLSESMPPESLQVLSQKTPDGRVTVMRVGAMGGVDYGIEYVMVEGGEFANIYIVLIASLSDKHSIIVKINKNDYNFQRMTSDAPGSFEIYDDYYVYPQYDQTRETCPSIIPGTINYVSVAPANHYISVPSKYDDWHFHQMTYKGIPPECSESPEIFRPYGREWVMTPQKTHYWHGSMSPVTAVNNNLITSRYIDQQKRNYFPHNMKIDFNEAIPNSFFAVIGTGNLVLPANVLAYYGKKPYTFNTISRLYESYGEAIEGVTQVELAGIGDKIAIQFFWPFIPYINEFGHLNLLDYDRVNRTLDGSVLATLYAWNLKYYSISGDLEQTPKLIDTASFNNSTYNREYAAPQTVVSYIYYTGTITEDIVETTSGYNGTITKHIPVGTIGNKGVAYVKSEIITSGEGPVFTSNSVSTTTGNFPINRIANGQFVSQFPAGNYRNDSSIVAEWQENARNDINITQQLKIGDDIIASGEGNLEYEMSRSGNSNYQGSWQVDITVPDEAPATGDCWHSDLYYTVLHMAPGTSQNLSAHWHTAASIKWSVIGGGSFSSDTAQNTSYTAPIRTGGVGMPPGWDCSPDNVVIVLTIGGVVCHTLSIAIDGAPGFGNDHAYHRKLQPGTISRGLAYCERVCQTTTLIYNCSGVVVHTQIIETSLPNDPDCYGETNLGKSCGEPTPPVVWVDLRTGAMLSGGCCPTALITAYNSGWLG